ncbi:MAG: elongation factor P [Oscillospiraceae bacterium]|jgi:elongation factor P|nr:elongation factor P [Oscillospiraceae bacterium]
MITAREFRNGVTFEFNEMIFSVIEFQHVKPGKGSAFVRAKLKNILSGGTIERTFNPEEKFQEAFIERRQMQYLYNDSDLYYFMDSQNFEQIPVSKKILNENFKFVKENMECKVSSYKDKVFEIEPPLFVELIITSTEPAIRGDTATNVTKPAILETGTEIRVPLFINEGEKIKIDTRTGEYIERA